MYPNIPTISLSYYWFYVFLSVDCQDNAVELGVADPREEEWRDDLAQRVLLRQGDFFFVPPGNIYRLENHSAVRSGVSLDHSLIAHTLYIVLFILVHFTYSRTIIHFLLSCQCVFAFVI